MNELDKIIDDCLKEANKYDELAVSCRETQDNYVRILGAQYKPDYSTSKACTASASKNRQIAEWLKELKQLREIPDKLVPKYRDSILDEYDRGANEMLEEVIDDIRKYIEEVNADEDNESA